MFIDMQTRKEADSVQDTESVLSRSENASQKNTIARFSPSSESGFGGSDSPHHQGGNTSNSFLLLKGSITNGRRSESLGSQISSKGNRARIFSHDSNEAIQEVEMEEEEDKSPTKILDHQKVVKPPKTTRAALRDSQITLEMLDTDAAEQSNNISFS